MLITDVLRRQLLADALGRVSHPGGLWVKRCVMDVGLLSGLLSGLTGCS